MANERKHRHISSFQIIILGFLSVILTGSLLLMLPFATRSGEWAAFSDALFTATSAVCVTGLVVQDTAMYWSIFGKTVILILIQIGGMGIVTVAVSVAILSGRKIGLMQRSTMKEAVSAHHVGGIVRLTKFILRTTLLIEMTGALILMPGFVKEFGPLRGIGYSFFHSVSAFCNAGFDLMGVKSEFSSLTSYSGSVLVNLTIMTLIVVGGIGFLSWEDIRKNGLNFHKYRMQTKVILSVTGALIVIPAVYFFFGEYGNLPIKERVLSSLFQAITPRTAGFNTTDLTEFSDTGKLMTIMLMLVGGSPGSTAGGMKTTTLAVLFSSAISVFLRKNDTYFFKRRIHEEAIRSAATVFMMYLALFSVGGMVISRLEGIPILTALFETASAIGTVGLTLGVTTSLGFVSRLILIALMFFGRVGGLTLIFAAVSGKTNNVSKYPQEKITVG
ncbi:MAG: potassium transporter TrkG [Clostridiales bacterium]|nr:potassium transporter TrkG [Clostridiales bacterium]